MMRFTKRIKKACLSTVLASFAAAAVLSAGAIEVSAHPFVDVTETSFAAPGVEYCFENEIMLGTDATHFNPTGTITRGMLAATLYRLAGSPEISGLMPFRDVKEGKYYYDSVRWAFRDGIMAGTEFHGEIPWETDAGEGDSSVIGWGLFSPDDPVTRQMAVTTLMRLADSYEDYYIVEGNCAAYEDAGQITDYARRPFAWAVKTGIVTGTSETTLSPKAEVTRGQWAAMLARYAGYIAAKGVKKADTAILSLAMTGPFSVTDGDGKTMAFSFRPSGVSGDLEVLEMGLTTGSPSIGTFVIPSSGQLTVDVSNMGTLEISLSANDTYKRVTGKGIQSICFGSGREIQLSGENMEYHMTWRAGEDEGELSGSGEGFISNVS